MAKGSAAVRLGLGSGGGMSVTTCGGGEAEGVGATGIEGGASRVGALRIAIGQGHDRGCRRHVGLRRDRRHRCARQAVSSPPRTKDCGREGEARQPASPWGSGRASATVPVSHRGIRRDRRRGLRGGGSILRCGLCGQRVLSRPERARRPARPASLALNGLRSGREGGTTAALAARAGFAAASAAIFATATAEATHANEANSKTCARMRFISSIGFRLRSCSQDVPRAGEPRR